MSPANAIHKSDAPVPPGTFIVERLGRKIDLSPILDVGAKHTVVYAAFAAALGIPAKIPSRRPNDHLKKYAQHNEYLYRALNRFVDAGLLERQNGVLDSMSVEPNQRRGIFWRAADAARQKPTNLINELQNSKSNEKQLTDDTEFPAKHYQEVPGKASWERRQAVRRLQEITDYTQFIRNPQTKQLNPHLTRKLSQVDALFDEWLKESEKKVILLRNLRTDEYQTKPYKTRFTDEGRKLKNLKIYMTGIENSLKKYQNAIFLTLTTDPQIWLRPKGEKFTRHIKDGRTYKFEGEGMGGNLYQANRHESTAWRKWYEKYCHREGKRVPYIRCVEFQENGLIHTHVLLFDVQWNMNWEDFAKEWGTQYKQGYLNKAYEVVNDGQKWTWKKHAPEDTQGRAPADYLKKYLIKSMYEQDGFFLYWACNKRFFTMSESLRYYSLDEKIEEEDWIREHQSSGEWEFVGTCTPENTPETIAGYLRKKYGRPRGKAFDTGEPTEQCRPSFYIRPRIRSEPAIENPDTDDDQEAAYKAQLELESKLRKERKAKLKQKNRLENLC